MEIDFSQYYVEFIKLEDNKQNNYEDDIFHPVQHDDYFDSSILLKI